jgi:hypothetical protein
MKSIKLLLFALFIGLPTVIQAQQGGVLILQSVSNPKKQKKLKLNEKYEFYINDRFCASKILGFTDSTLTLFVSKSILLSKQEIANSIEYRDRKKSVFTIDTIVIPFAFVQLIDDYYIKNREFLILPGYLGIASIAAIPFYPLASWAQTGAVDIATIKDIVFVAAISWSIVYLGTRKRSYDTQNKWIIKTIRK